MLTLLGNGLRQHLCTAKCSAHNLLIIVCNQDMAYCDKSASMYLVKSILLQDFICQHRRSPKQPTEGLARSVTIHFCTHRRTAFRLGIELALKVQSTQGGGCRISLLQQSRQTPPGPLPRPVTPNVTVCLALCTCPRLREHPRQHQLVDSCFSDSLLTENLGMTDPTRYTAYKASTAISWSQNSRSGALRNSAQSYEFNRYSNPSELV